MKIIKTPWKDDLIQLVQSSKKSIKMTSPFVKENICREIISAKKQNTALELVTSFNIKNIHSGSLDLDGIESIISNKGLVLNYSKIHSKIYLFDEKKVVITSGNLTNGGLVNNYEYGIYTDDKQIVAQVVNDFRNIVSHENVGKIKTNNIKVVRGILEKMPKAKKIKYSDFHVHSADEFDDVIEIEDSILTSSFTGWKKEVFKCVQSLENQVFTSKEMKSFEEKFKQLYPTNTEIAAKIRQQLQELRDLGLIEFLGNGNYKKLWK